MTSAPAPTVSDRVSTEDRLARCDPRLLDTLRDQVIDPDLGVNLVDTGFIRAARTDGDTLVWVMTLTSAACPLTKIIEERARGRRWLAHSPRTFASIGNGSGLAAARHHSRWT